MCCTRCAVRKFIARQGWDAARLCQEIDATEHEANITKWLSGKALICDVALLGRMEALMKRPEPAANP